MRKLCHIATLAALAFMLFLPVIADGAERPEYLESFDPAKGFKPAQRDLTEVFLQLAGSLESYGSPEPYLRHVAAEHIRIEGLYRQKFGKNPTSFRPAYITDNYIDGLAKNWNFLSPKLGLEPFAKQVGNTMRDAIKGTRGTGTIVVDIFNQHQGRVFDQIAGKGKRAADFESLRTSLVSRLEINKTQIHDADYEVARRDAVRSAAIIRAITTELFAKLDQSLKPADAARLKTYLTSVFMDVGEMAQSELQAGISEWALGKMSTAAK